MQGSGYVWKRVGFAVVTVFVALTLNFVLFRVLPGGPVSQISRVPNASPALKQALIAQFGLDKPLWEQYLLYLGQTLHGNLGVSYMNRQPVFDNLIEAFANTIPMVALGTILALVIGIAAGVVSAVRRGSAIDHLSTNIAVLFYAFPTQFLGMMLLIAFAGILPAAGMNDPFAIGGSRWDAFLDMLKHMILPVTTLALTLYAENALIVRSAMLETLGEDYILTAKAKGVPRGRLIRAHALRNAMLPIVTMVAMSLGAIVTGSILIEVIFSWPGIGRALYTAVLKRDYPMLQGGFLAITVVVITFNLFADLIYHKLDPRIAT
ncbi:ABC transporter permease [Pseudaminobacter soli (ex Li et al. 2025)]|uniref:ABC transporter permease n=1 Tax=Pseudaminobacter soli (ex Li et al. 2025) TaxID=1295366 RepID=A0A2P7S8X4_9HYPH|nr:ABC transporter permease [Mesorhizobium soli]PSJ58881.1 ABC transporter permease [Mesorhizobium soli]